MRLDELFGLFGKDDKLDTEENTLAVKAKGIYGKSVDNLEKVMDRNAEAFDAQPFKAFSQWFEHVYEKSIDRMIKTKEIKINDQNIAKMAKPLIALASINYYLRPKTPVAGFKKLLRIGSRVVADKQIMAVVDKTFGKFIEKGPTGQGLDINAKPKTGTTYDTGENGKFTWVGAMWVDEKQQPASKDVQGALTQKARDEGKTA